MRDPTQNPSAEGESGAPEDGRFSYLLAALAIGGLVGIGLAATWIPERRRRRTIRALARRYQQARESGGARLGDLRKTSQELASDFREELGASVEAAREEFSDMAGQQLKRLRRNLRREYQKLRS